MKNHLLSIALLMSISTANFMLKASDAQTPQYTFNDFDKCAFYNHYTYKVELIYPTSLVESVSNDPITLKVYEWEQLLYPALTRLVYKKRDLSSKHDTCEFLAKNDSSQEQAKHQQKAKIYREHLNYIEAVNSKIKAMQSIPATYDGNVTFLARDLMLVVQFAVYKIERLDSGSTTIITDKANTQYCYAYDTFKTLLDKYKAYEQQ